jgi:hypothetical protein
VSAVLITGSSGRIGRAVIAELLARGHRVRGFDRVQTPGLSDMILGEIGDRAALDRAMGGMDCLIHLAATPDDDDFFTRLVPDNIIGLHHVMEAARCAGVKRLVLASSGQVNSAQQITGPFPIRTTDEPTPRYWYAATKMFMESIGYSFAERHGISVIVARLGWCPRTRSQVEEIRAADWAQDVYLSPGDAGRFFACAVEAPADVRHAVLYATSLPVHRTIFDLTPTKALLGYEPRERWPQGIEIVIERLHAEAGSLERADAFEARASGAQRRHHRHAAAAGGAADFDLVLTRGLATRGVNDEGQFAVLQHVERVGPAFGELEELLHRHSGGTERRGGAASGVEREA